MSAYVFLSVEVYVTGKIKVLRFSSFAVKYVKLVSLLFSLVFVVENDVQIELKYPNNFFHFQKYFDSFRMLVFAIYSFYFNLHRVK